MRICLDKVISINTMFNLPFFYRHSLVLIWPFLQLECREHHYIYKSKLLRRFLEIRVGSHQNIIIPMGNRKCLPWAGYDGLGVREYNSNSFARWAFDIHEEWVWSLDESLQLILSFLFNWVVVEQVNFHFCVIILVF